MFVINEDLTIECTRGDAAVFSVSANLNNSAYEFREDDVVRFSVCEKKDYSTVVLQKEVTVEESGEAVEIFLDSEDTKIGEGINKATEYWYEVEVNTDNKWQTIIGHDSNGAKKFILYPEAQGV